MKLRQFFDNIKPSWHRWPIPKNIRILSVYEIAAYILFLILFVFLYYALQIVPCHNDVITIQRIHHDTYDSTKLSFVVKYKIPMTYVYDRNGGSGRMQIELIPDSNTTFKPSREINSLTSFYLSFNTDSIHKPTYSIYQFKNTQKHNLIKQAIYVNKPWEIENYITKYGIKRNIEENDHYVVEIIGPSYAKITLEDCNGFGPLSRPQWYALYDISQSYYDLNFETSFDGSMINIDFVGVSEFSKMIPEPDEIDMGSITFTDKNKLDRIRKKGLKFYVRHKELENFQNSRMFFVTAVMGALVAIFITFVVLSFFKVSRKIKNRIKNLKRNRKSGNSNVSIEKSAELENHVDTIDEAQINDNINSNVDNSINVYELEVEWAINSQIKSLGKVLHDFQKPTENCELAIRSSIVSAPHNESLFDSLVIFVQLDNDGKAHLRGTISEYNYPQDDIVYKYEIISFSSFDELLVWFDNYYDVKEKCYEVMLGKPNM